MLSVNLEYSSRIFFHNLLKLSLSCCLIHDEVEYLRLKGGSITEMTSRIAFNRFPPEEFAERWKKTGVPHRPSVNEQQIYSKFLGEAAERGDDPKMIVLGVTPELRKLGHKHGYQVTCVDFSPMFITAMDILMGEEGEKDIIVRCNWLETPLPRGQYDVVVGDGSMNMVELKDWERLLKIVHDLLKPGGYFVTRILVGMEDPISLLDALKRFGKQLFRYPERYVGSLWYTTITPENTFGSYRLREPLEKLRENGDITDDEFNTISVWVGRAGKIDVYMIKQNHFEEILSKYFQVKGFDYDKELHDAEGLIAMLPIYCAVKKC